jgi:hypothetical protein
MGVARAILTHVVKVGYGQGASCGNKDALEDWLQGRAAPLRAARLEVEIDIRAAGEVAKDILQAASEHGADLIVIGSRGQNMIRGLFLGSVAREVIRPSTPQHRRGSGISIDARSNPRNKFVVRHRQTLGTTS